jgi:hypothetical protein
MPTKAITRYPLGLNLDIADRVQCVTCGCLALYAAHRTSEIGAWRQRMADADFPQLLFELQGLGVDLRSGNRKFFLPLQMKGR